MNDNVEENVEIEVESNDISNMKAVFYRYKFPFNAAAMELLFSTVEKILKLQFPLEIICQESNIGITYYSSSTSSPNNNNNNNNNNNKCNISSKSISPVKVEAMLQRERDMQRLIIEYENIQRLLIKQRKLKEEDQQIIKQLHLENEKLKQIGISEFVRAAEKIFLSPLTEKLLELPHTLDDGYDHVSVIINSNNNNNNNNNSIIHLEDKKEKKEAVSLFMPAQVQREVKYLLHVLQAAHNESEFWQKKCNTLQNEMESLTPSILLLKEKQEKEDKENEIINELQAEINSLRLALNQEEKDKLVLLQEIIEMRREHAEMLQESQKFGEDEIKKLINQNISNDNMESGLEQIARGALPSSSKNVDSPSSIIVNNNNNNNNVNNNSANPSSIFTSPPLITFPRPSVQLLQAARRAIEVKTNNNNNNNNNNNKYNFSGPPIPSPRRTLDDNIITPALLLLHRLVPDINDKSLLFDMIVAIYDGINRLVGRWRRAEENSRRNSKKLHELELKVLHVSQLEEDVKRQQLLNSALHCRAEEREDCVRRLKEKLNLSRNKIKEMKLEQEKQQQQQQQIEEEQKQNEKEVNEEEKKKKKKNNNNNNSGNNNKKKIKKNKINIELEKEINRANEAEAALHYVQEELRKANEELHQGKRLLLACLVQDGEDEIKTQVNNLYSYQIKEKKEKDLKNEKLLDIKKQQEDEDEEKNIMNKSPDPLPPSPQYGNYVESTSFFSYSKVEKKEENILVTKVKSETNNPIKSLEVSSPFLLQSSSIVVKQEEETKNESEIKVNETKDVLATVKWEERNLMAALEVKSDKEIKKKKKSKWGEEIEKDEGFGPWGNW